MYNIIGTIVSFFANLIPTTNIILFHSFPDAADNSFAICRYLYNNGVSDRYRFVWLISEYEKKFSIKKQFEKEGIKVDLVKRLSIKGLWLVVRARYVFVTHGMFDAINLYQHKDKVINLWHGMPLKLLGASEVNGLPGSTNFNYIISSSPYYQKVMSEVFATTLDKVLITGQPRCDMLFEATEWFENVGIDRKLYKKIGIFSIPICN